jgi:hypothetical protein
MFLVLSLGTRRSISKGHCGIYVTDRQTAADYSADEYKTDPNSMI